MMARNAQSDPPMARRESRSNSSRGPNGPCGKTPPLPFSAVLGETARANLP